MSIKGHHLYVSVLVYCNCLPTFCFLYWALFIAYIRMRQQLCLRPHPTILSLHVTITYVTFHLFIVLCTLFCVVSYCFVLLLEVSVGSPYMFLVTFTGSNSNCNVQFIVIFLITIVKYYSNCLWIIIQLLYYYSRGPQSTSTAFQWIPPFPNISFIVYDSYFHCTSV